VATIEQIVEARSHLRFEEVANRVPGNKRHEFGWQSRRMTTGSRMRPGEHPALLVVDVQRDFCPGGALPARGGNEIVPAINRYLAKALECGVPIYASRDWHPVVTTHFKPYGGEWPPHCVQDTEAAEFHPDLELPLHTIVISKGGDPDRPGYSAFDGRTPDGRAFAADLRDRQIDGLYITGLTTEYCVKQTALDALRAGLSVTILTDAISGIDAQPGDAGDALTEMSNAGAALSSGLVTLSAR
jgi:nicotinamidase/pyrazinamidase